MNLRLRDVTAGDLHDVDVRRLLVAGFTGRDVAAVTAHVDELRELGVPVPASVPTFYGLDPGLVTTGGTLQASGAFTSGEVEPVVIVTDDRWWLSVGSDHTDRDLEAESIELSKAACAKPISGDVVPLEHVTDWDAVAVRSWADGTPYQAGTLADLLPLEEILAAARDAGIQVEPGDVVFLGTVPVPGGLRAAERFDVAMDVGDHRLAVEYRIDPPHNRGVCEQRTADEKA